jgi:hypothetical protein
VTGPVIDATATEQPDGPVDDGGFDYVPCDDCETTGRNCRAHSGGSTTADNSAANVTPGDIERRDDEAASAPTTGALAVLDQPPVIGELATVPAGDELRALAQMAVTFASASLVPKALRDKPADVLLVLMTARDLGLTVTTALRKLHVIDGQVTVAPTLKLAIVRQRRLGRVWKDAGSGPGWAKWYAIRADDPAGFVESSEYGVTDARSQGLVGADCDPTAGTHGRGSKQAAGWLSCGCKRNWAQSPQRMPSHRALGYLMDDVFPEVGTGLYSPDELGAIVDAEGNPVIDVTEVGPVDGMPVPEPSPAQRQAQADAEYISPDDAWQLQARILSLPDEQRLALRERWKAQDRLGQRPPWAIPSTAVTLARNLVAGVESDAAKTTDGYDRNVRPAELATSLAETAIMILSGRIYPDDGPPAVPEFDVDGPGDDSPPPVPDMALDSPEPIPGTPGPETAPDAATGEPAPDPGTLATSAANGRPGLDALEDLAERRGRVTETVTREVQALTLQQVDEELRIKKLPTDGGGGARRMRLITVEVETRIGLPMPDEIHEQVAPLMGDDDAPAPQEDHPDE